MAQIRATKNDNGMLLSFYSEGGHCLTREGGPSSYSEGGPRPRSPPANAAAPCTSQLSHHQAQVDRTAVLLELCEEPRERVCE